MKKYRFSVRILKEYNTNSNLMKYKSFIIRKIYKFLWVYILCHKIVCFLVNFDMWHVALDLKHKFPQKLFV